MSRSSRKRDVARRTREIATPSATAALASTAATSVAPVAATGGARRSAALRSRGALWRRLLAAGGVVAIALLVFSNATPPVAIHDDAFFVPARHDLSGPSIAQIFAEDMWSSTGSPAGVYRPLVVLSIAANGALSGRNPVGYHVTNVLLHALASLVVFLLLAGLLARGAPELGERGVAIAALAAAIFAVHPVHAEAVNSVYNRSEILSCIFVGSGLLLLLRWHERHTVAAWIAVAACYFVALLCRESAVSLPLLAMLMLWFLHGAEAPRQRLLRVAPALLLAVPLAEYFVLRGFAMSQTVQTTAPALGVDAGQDFVSRLLYSIAALREYARMMVWPHPLRVSYENFRGDGLATALAVHALLLASAFALRRRAPLVSWAIAFFYVALIPSTRLFTSSGATLSIGGFVLLKPQGGLVLVGERVAYLPSVAFAVAVAFALAAGLRRFGWAAVATVAAVVVLAGGLVTYDRNRAWASAVELFSREVAATPDNGDAWRLYVSALSGAGRYEDAARACDGQLEQQGRSAQLFNNCGIVYDRLGRDAAAIRSYQRTIELGLAAVGHANLGRAYARAGRMAEAEAEFVAAAEAETNPAQKHYRVGSMLLRFHPDRSAEARREFEAALTLRPDYAAARQALDSLPR